VMFPDRLERQVAFLDAHPECAAVGSRSLVVDAGGRPMGVIGRYFSHEAIDAAHLNGIGGALGNNGATFRRSAALSIGGFEGFLSATGEDHDFWLRLGEVGRMACLPDVLNGYRVHQTNTSLGAGSSDRRLPVTLATLTRTFARRGLEGRTPAKLAAAPRSMAERWADRALVRFYSGHRLAAMAMAVPAFLLAPTAPAVRGALRRIALGRATPPARRDY
ncbi:MAG: hypothetical protein ABI661_06850, partial [Gammaproteobacteria bacterium]